MKTRISIIAASLLMPLLLANVVLAEDNAQATSEPKTTLSQQETETNNKPQELTATQKAELKSRLDKRKADAKLRLTTVQEKRLQARCKNAQGLVMSVSGKSNGLETSRAKIHSNLLERLTKLEAKLTENEVNTDTLKAQTVELQAKITTFNTDFSAYKQAVSDLASIEDCTTDPTAFKASLDASRAALQKVRDDAAAIRNYVKDVIKPTLATIRAELDAKKANSGEAN